MSKEFKFDNFESLQNSYCELEKKFTQKCQHNAELERQQAELMTERDQLLNEKADIDKQNQEILTQHEQLKKQLEELQNRGTNADNASPQLSVEQLYDKHPLAYNFKDSIDKAIANPEYAQSADAWKEQYMQCLENSYRTPKDLAQDEQFLQQYIVSDAKVRDLVLQQMLVESLNNKYPVTMSGNGGDMSMAQPNRPKTIQEASILAKNYFK